MAKRRADQLLVDRGLAESRAKAQALIIAGLVTMAGRRIDKPGTALAEDAELTVSGRDHPWVSRGGLKLASALERFAIRVGGAVALDIGASTGGFTDVLLAHGAALVHAVDVGRGQLAWKLRQDPRVVVHEGVNARYLTRGGDPGPDRPDHLRRQLHRTDDRAAGTAGIGGGTGRPCRADQAAIRGRTGARSERAASCAIRRFTARCASACRPGSRRNPAGASSASPKARCRAPRVIANSCFMPAAGWRHANMNERRLGMRERSRAVE